MENTKAKENINKTKSCLFFLKKKKKDKYNEQIFNWTYLNQVNLWLRN